MHSRQGSSSKQATKQVQVQVQVLLMTTGDFFCLTQFQNQYPELDPGLRPSLAPFSGGTGGSCLIFWPPGIAHGHKRPAAGLQLHRGRAQGQWQLVQEVASFAPAPAVVHAAAVPQRPPAHHQYSASHQHCNCNTPEKVVYNSVQYY